MHKPTQNNLQPSKTLRHNRKHAQTPDDCSDSFIKDSIYTSIILSESDEAYSDGSYNTLRKQMNELITNEKIVERRTDLPGRDKSLLKQLNINEIQINPDNFTPDVIINMLDQEKLKLLEVEFKKIDIEDQIMLRMREKILSIMKGKMAVISWQNSTSQYISKRNNQEQMLKQTLEKDNDDNNAKHVAVRQQTIDEIPDIVNGIFKKQPKFTFSQDPGLTMSQWVRVMLRILINKKDYQIMLGEVTNDFYDLIFGLCQLFQEFDINGDGRMDWSELIQFLLDTVNQRELTTFDLEQANEENKSHEDESQENYKSNISKVTGKSDFSYVSHFSKVNELKEELEIEINKKHLHDFIQSKYYKYHQSELLKYQILHKSSIHKFIYNIQFQCFLILESDLPRKIDIGKSKDKEENIEKHIFKKENEQVIYRDRILRPHFEPIFHILNMAFSQKYQVLGLTASNGRLYFYRSREAAHSILFNLKQIFAIDVSKTCGVQIDIYYLQKHDSWITVGKDNIVREWTLDQDRLKLLNSSDWNHLSYINQFATSKHQNSNQYLYLLDEHSSHEFDGSHFLVHQFGKIHKEQITDVIEITKPLLMVTSSIDKLTRLISLAEKTIVGIFQGHSNGVRQMDYTPYQNGYMVTVGYESYLNIWTLDGGIDVISNTIGNSGKGKWQSSHHFKLHSSGNIMKASRFFEDQPFCVSVDSSFHIRIFNFITKKVVQNIKPIINFTYEIRDIAILSNQHRFAIISQRVTFFEIDNIRFKNDEQLENQLTAIPTEIGDAKKIQIQKAFDKITSIVGVCFNQFSGNFIVCTQNELRQYNGANGQLVKIFSDIQDSRSNAEIKSFNIDSHGKKVILGDAEGTIRILNLSNGVTLMTLTNRDDVDFEARRNSEGASRNRLINQIETITGYTNNKNLIITSNVKSEIAVYNEQLSAESSAQHKLSLRQMETMDSEKDHINVIAISMEHSLIASGNSLGQVVTWDLETASMLHIQYAAKDENIVFLQFLADYPLMVAATAEGTISVWGTRGASTESLYNCVGRFKNTPIQISSDVAGFSYLSKLITCGTSEVVQISSKIKVFESDTITYDKKSFKPEFITSDKENVGKLQNSTNHLKYEVLDKLQKQDNKPNFNIIKQNRKSKPSENEKQSMTDIINKRCLKNEELFKERIMHEKIKLNKHKYPKTQQTETIYDRAIAILGLHSGCIQFLDLTHYLDQMDSDTDSMILHDHDYANEQSNSHDPEGQQQSMKQVQPERCGKFYKMKKIKEIVHLNSQYNPLRHVVKSQDYLKTTQLLKQCEQAEDILSFEESLHPYLNTIETIELRLFNSHKLAKDRSYDTYAHQLTNRKQRYCRGIIQAHSRPILQIKMLHYNDNVEFTTCADDKLIKIFSLQIGKYSSISIKQLAVIDMNNQTHHNFTWNFPFDNYSMIQKQSQTFKQVYQELFAHELRFSKMRNRFVNLKIQIRDNRREQQKFIQGLMRSKKQQMQEVMNHIQSQLVFTDKEKVAKKFEKLRMAKIQMKLKKLEAKKLKYQVLQEEQEYHLEQQLAQDRGTTSKIVKNEKEIIIHKKDESVQIEKHLKDKSILDLLLENAGAEPKEKEEHKQVVTIAKSQKRKFRDVKANSLSIQRNILNLSDLIPKMKMSQQALSKKPKTKKQGSKMITSKSLQNLEGMNEGKLRKLPAFEKAKDETQQKHGHSHHVQLHSINQKFKNLTSFGQNTQFMGGNLHEPDLHVTDKYNLQHGIQRYSEFHEHIVNQKSRAGHLPHPQHVNDEVNDHYPLYAEFLKKAINDTEKVRLHCSKKIPLKSQRSATQHSLGSLPQTPVSKQNHDVLETYKIYKKQNNQLPKIKNILNEISDTYKGKIKRRNISTEIMKDLDANNKMQSPNKLNAIQQMVKSSSKKSIKSRNRAFSKMLRGKKE